MDVIELPSSVSSMTPRSNTVSGRPQTTTEPLLCQSGYICTCVALQSSARLNFEPNSSGVFDNHRLGARSGVGVASSTFLALSKKQNLNGRCRVAYSHEHKECRLELIWCWCCLIYFPCGVFDLYGIVRVASTALVHF